MENNQQQLTTLQDSLNAALTSEADKFQRSYQWLKESMLEEFFAEVDQETIFLITHALIGLQLQGYFTTINTKHMAISICLNSVDADVRILKNFSAHGIQSYRSYISTANAPFEGCQALLRIAIVHFTSAQLEKEYCYPVESKDQLRALVQRQLPEVSDQEFDLLISQLHGSFFRALPLDRIALALEMFFRAKTRDNCQYEVRYNDNWQETGQASMQIVFAWKNTPKNNFLYQIANVIHNHQLVMKQVNAAYIDPHTRNSILIMALDLHGANGQATWDATDIPDFLRAFATLKYFAEEDAIASLLVSKGLISGNNGTLLRSIAYCIQQGLVHIDPHLYTLDRIKEDLCYQPTLSRQLCEAFDCKFNPQSYDVDKFNVLYSEFYSNVEKIDSGSEGNDARRKNVLWAAISFVRHTLKTNFFRTNYSALSFKIDPEYLNQLPVDHEKLFPVEPYAIFFIKGLRFFGFHIRFKDLSRGGLRTVYLEPGEQALHESNNVFAECYNLALTQHMKNKDIPEGGAKGIIFLKPWDRLDGEAQILENELREADIPDEVITQRLATFCKEQKEEYLYQAQRAFIQGLITIINCDADGTIRAKNVVDYYKRPEYIYLGPDENMHDSMIEWIADFSKKYNYKPGGCFISGKPTFGINHKHYGVTSLGVNVYMETVLNFLNIDPKTTPFTIKMSGGPDGDVAGNQIVNLARDYPQTAKLVALTDGSGTIYEPQGLDLQFLVGLFQAGKPISFYPPEKLSPGAILLDKFSKRAATPFAQQTLCWKKLANGQLVEEWMSGGEMNSLLRNNVHQTTADIFIPAGGRPRTLNENNIQEFLDKSGKPTAKAIVEGANLYLTPRARSTLEKLGVLIIQDSSANKTGVICSSFEILCGLALGEKEFMAHKGVLVNEILERLKECAANEANLLFRTHQATGEPLTEISARISKKINLYTYQLLDFLTPQTLDLDPETPLMRCFFSYCLPTLREHFRKELLREIPDIHKKAIIACHLGAQLVYSKGLSWHPTVVDVLPILLSQ